MVSYEFFYDFLKKSIVEYLPENLANKLYYSSTAKPDGIKDTVSLIPEMGADKAVMGPCMYIDDLYNVYKSNGNIEETVKGAADTLLKACKNMPELAPLTKEAILDNVFIQMINSEQSHEMIKNCPNIKYLDLSIVFRTKVDLDSTADIGTVLITNSIAEKYGLTVSELYERAVNNSEGSFIVKPITSVLRQIGYPLEEFEGIELIPMMILGVNTGLYGASAITNVKLFESLSEKWDSDIFIIPSSIHELIVVKADEEMDANSLRESIREVNDNEVIPEERLSYNLYVYKRATGRISIA